MVSPASTTTAGAAGTIAYADCFSGISGDMFLGALVDAGLPEETLAAEVSKLALKGYRLSASPHGEGFIRSTLVKVETFEKQPARSLRAIRSLITRSSLAPGVKEKSLGVFNLLATAEARVHGCSVEDVHFHELGAVDAIIDIVGTVAGLAYLGINRLVSSPLPMPRGWISCEHGLLPVPAPAVLEILQGAPVYGVEMDQEMVTPTGAALIRSLSHSFGPLPGMLICKAGYGAGSRQLPGRQPNLFRLILGEIRELQEAQEVEVIETNLDDWSPESFPYLLEQLSAAGALDVSLAPIQMKKGRPGFLLRVIAEPAKALAAKTCILSETTAIGLRFRIEKRLTLPRKKGKVLTPWGAVAVKKVETPKGPVLYPEYEDCRRVAVANRVSLKDVYAGVACCPIDGFMAEPEVHED